MSLKHWARRSEGISPISLDGAAQFRFFYGFNDDVDIGPELLIEQGLNPTQIDKIEPSSDCRGHNHVDVAHFGFIAPCNRSEYRSMRYSACLKRSSQLSKDCKGLIAFHATKIRHTRIKFTEKWIAPRPASRGQQAPTMKTPA